MISFSFAHAASVTQVRYVQNQLVNVFRTGGTFRDFKKLVREGEISLALPDRHLENIFRTNIMTAYARGSYLEQAASAEVFPWGKYTAILDSATRPAHRKLDGVIVRVGSDDYNRIYPPNGYNCRCTMISLTDSQAKREKIYSDNVMRSKIDAHPPDSGFEGPPFYGEIPEGMLMPPKMTEEQLLQFINTDNVATKDNYKIFMDVLEKAGADATSEQIKAATNKIIEDVTKEKKKQMKFNLDKYMNSLYEKLASPIKMTNEDKKIKAKVQQDIVSSFIKSGINVSTVTEKNEAIKQIMLDMFNDMNIVKNPKKPNENLFYYKAPEDRWDFYLNLTTGVDAYLKDGYPEYETYSALTMRYLEPEDRI
jgi:SPP1 gp7 family putative phage head morphogenesis protein